MSFLNSLISYYGLDSDATDFHQSHDGSAVGVAWGTAGKINNCGNFTSDSILVPAHADFNNSAVSAFAWINASDVTNRYILSYYDISSKRSWLLYLNSSGKLEALLSNDGGNTQLKRYQSATSISVSTWYHVGFTFESNDLKLYVNGSEETPTILDQYTIGSLYTSTIKPCIGALTDGGSVYASNKFSGLIDEVGIWSEVLTPSQVSDLFNSGSGLAYTNFAYGVTIPDIAAGGTFSAITGSINTPIPDISAGGAFSVPNVYKGWFLTIPDIAAGGTFSAITGSIHALIPDIAAGGTFAAITGSVHALVSNISAGGTFAVPSISTTRITKDYIKFFLSLTGSPNITMPIKQFEIRMYSDNPTCFGATIPGVDYADQISDRSGGNLVFSMAYCDRVTGNVLQSEPIVTVPLLTVNVDEGSVNKSITVSGYETTAQAAAKQSYQKTVTIDLGWLNYKRTVGGLITARLVKPHIFLRPGDTVDDGEDTYTASRITWINSEEYHHMEIQEAA